MKRTAIAVALAITISAPAWSQAGKQVKFDGQKTLGYIKVMADDAMAGRKSGLPGGDQQAPYIEGKFREWGIEPAGDNGTYFQKFAIKDMFNVEPGAVLELTSGAKTRTLHVRSGLFDQWTVYNLSGSADVNAELVFAGFGIHSPENGYDDFAGIDLKGKIALIFNGMPGDIKGIDPSTDARVRAARENGAAAVIFAMPPSPYGQEMIYPARGAVSKAAYDPNFAVVGINQEAANFIFQDLKEDYREIVNEIGRTLKPRSFATGVTARLKVKTSFWPERETANVLGKIKGTDPRLRDEVILIGAHMDHLGITPEGEVYNGADDNASGTAVVMEVARLMKENRIKPKRTIVFACWAGEEQGLLGSTNYVEHPIFPLERTAVNLNLDMVGQGRDTISVGGVYFCRAVWKVLEKELPSEAMIGISTRRGLGGSDCLPFINKGVPAFHIIGNEVHIKGHDPRDDWDLIDPEMLVRAERFVYHASRVLAQTAGNIFSPEFMGRTMFLNNEILNCRAVPLDAAVAGHKNDAKPDVDWQLVYPEMERTATASADREKMTALLAELPDKLKDLSGVNVYGVKTNRPQSRTARDLGLIMGLDDPSLVKDNPAWLRQASKDGIKYVRLRTADLALDGTSLAGGALAMVQGIQKAGCLLIADGVEGPARTALLKAAVAPMLLVTDGMLSGEEQDMVKKGGHVVGLIFKASAKPEAYFQELKSARDIYGISKLLVWNERDLWDEAAQTSYIRLAELMRQASWGEAESRYGAAPMGRVLYGNLGNLLRRGNSN